jgi:hypothetical protein
MPNGTDERRYSPSDNFVTVNTTAPPQEQNRA